MPLFAACAARREATPAVPVAPVDAGPDFELVSDDPIFASRAPGPAERENLLLVDEFDSLDPRWSELAAGGGAASSPPHVQLFAEGSGARGIVVLSPGAGGLHLELEFTGVEALLVTARVRSFAQEHDALLVASNEVESDGAHPLQRALAASADFAESSLYVGRCRGRRSVRIGLVPGDRPLAVDRIEVRRLRPFEELWLAPPVEGSPPLPRGRHRVELASMDLEMEGFFVPVGTALRRRARVPAGRPRLDLATCAVGGEHGGSLEWSVVVDGVVLERRWQRLVPAEREGPFSPWVVPLDRFAGREVAIELRCAGERELLGFAGAPRVLGGASGPAPPDGPPNVIVVSLDTLRPDRIGPRPDGASLTPRLDELVARGTLFTDACSTSSWTLPAQASLLTGQHPLVHRVTDSDRPIDARRSPLVAERFRSRGYATAAFTAGGFVDPRFGFGRGFDVYSVRDPCGLPHDDWIKDGRFDPLRASDDDIDATSKRPFDWLRRHADVPFFLLLHTYHVHEYDDDEHDGPNSGRCELLDRATAGDRASVVELSRRYDVCVAETDHDLVGGLLDLLRELDLQERTIVAVVSDHGEEFLEHGGFRHGLTLRDEVGSVVMVLAGPGVPRGARIDSPVSLTGVAPTLARLAGLPPDPRCLGRDLFRPDDDEPHAILLHLDHRCIDGHRARGEALWLGDWQVQRMWGESGEETLSFERRDPATGLFSAAEPAPAERRALERRLDAEIVERLRSAPPVADSERIELPESLRERLKALGYAAH